MARSKKDPKLCAECKTAPAKARGLCLRCYTRLRDRGLLDERYPLAQKDKPPEDKNQPVIRAHKYKKEKISVTFTIQSDNADDLCRMIRDELDWILQRI